MEVDISRKKERREIRRGGMTSCKEKMGVTVSSSTLSYFCPRDKLIKTQNFRLSVEYNLAELLER